MGRPRTIGRMACILLMMVGIVRAGLDTQFHGQDNHRHQRSSFSSSNNYAASSFNSPSNLQALGIQQPSAHALGQRRSSRYWWQDSLASPFSEGAAKKVGIRASSFGADPPRAHSRPHQDFRQQPYSSPQQQQLQSSYAGTAAATFTSQTISAQQFPSFPGCAAALKCVEERFCNMEGVMVNDPVSLTPLQKEYRVPLMPCLNVDTKQEGFCCRDPLYEDPWPADMPMPGMGPKPIPAATATATAVISAPNKPPQQTGYPVQQPPTPSFPIPVPQTNVIPPAAPPAPSVQQISTNYLPPPAAPVASIPAPVQTQVVQPAANQQQQTFVQPAPVVAVPQKPWPGPFAPVVPYPGCAAALKCVPEELCSLEGIMVNQAVRLTAFEKEYLRVPLMGCLNNETKQEGFCCRDPLYEDPWPADMIMNGMMAKPQPTPVASNSIVAIQQPAPVQQQYLPPPVQQQTYNPPPAVQQTYIPPPVQQQTYNPPPVQQQPSYNYNPAPSTQQQQTFKPLQPAYNPPVQQQLTPVQQPQQPAQYQQPQKPYEGPLAADVPYPGCAAALKCVEERFCNMEGVMVNEPVSLTPQQREFRVPLMACTNVDTKQVGFCCRDPLYEDPWPVDMPMPGMAKH